MNAVGQAESGLWRNPHECRFWCFVSPLNALVGEFRAALAMLARQTASLLATFPCATFVGFAGDAP
ncbi:hypothetical protein N9276_00960, partial [Rhodopirellula sp.]|nr:hypothetical protein [Rhodopirellula sp.]